MEDPESQATPARSSHRPGHSAIHWLPQEIIGKILLHALEPGFYDNRPRATTLNTREGVWVFGQVCHLWRQEILSHPSLWANFQIRSLQSADKYHGLYSNYVPVPPSSPEILKEILKRSQNHDITMHVFLPIPTMAEVEILNLLVAESSRWRRVTFALSCRLYMPLLSPIQHNLPLLEHLSLVCSNREKYSPEGLQALMGLFTDCPSLKRVSSQGFADLVDTPIPWSQITHFRHDYTSDLPRLFMQLTNAVHIETELKYIPRQRVPHPTLKFLELGRCGFEEVYEMLDLPGIEEIHATSQVDLELTVRRHPNQIKRLQIHFPLDAPITAMPNLSALSSLTTLVFFIPPSPTALYALSKEKGVLPNLSEVFLEFGILNDDELITSLFSFIRSRSLKAVWVYSSFGPPGGGDARDSKKVEETYQRYCALLGREMERENKLRDFVVGWRHDMNPFSDDYWL